MKKFTVPFLAAVVAASFVFTGCSPVKPQSPVATATASSEVTSSATPEASSKPVETNTPVVAGNSTANLLNSLTVSPALTTGYDRELFNHWVSKNNTGCDTRIAVLARDANNAPINGCSVNATWTSIYDGVTSSNPKDFDIDHMVPLAEAWDSGAAGWDSATREAYANDLGYAYSLIAVSASSNRSKSDKDPAKWMPPTMDACEYVGRWVAVKYRWNLAVDQAEKDKILSVLAWCNGDYALPVAPEKASVNVVTPLDVLLAQEKAGQPVGGADSGATPSEPAAEIPPVASTGGDDPKFNSCKEVKSNGLGPYVRGTDPEYEWYRDGDGDGTVCE